MATQSQFVDTQPIIVPVDDETQAMLNYAQSPEGCAKIEQARNEIRKGKSITVTNGYFEEMNRRITERIKRGHSSES